MHGSLGDAGLGVDLLEDSVDVYGESLNSSTFVGVLGGLSNNLLGDLLGSGGALCGAGSLLGSHFD